MKHATLPTPGINVLSLRKAFLILYYIGYILYRDYTNTALKQPNQLCMSKCGEHLVAVWMFEHQTAENSYTELKIYPIMPYFILP